VSSLLGSIRVRRLRLKHAYVFRSPPLLADLLASGRPCVRAARGVRIDSLIFVTTLYDNSEGDSITTLFRRVSDVGLNYTPMRHPKVRDHPIASLYSFLVISMIDQKLNDLGTQLLIKMRVDAGVTHEIPG
jgi:hypothetical protein